MDRKMHLGRKTTNLLLLNSYFSIVIFVLFTKAEISTFAILSTIYFIAGFGFYLFVLTKKKSCGHSSLLQWSNGFFAPFVRERCPVCGDRSLN
jgi:hypothetical protein